MWDVKIGHSKSFGLPWFAATKDEKLVAFFLTHQEALDYIASRKKEQENETETSNLSDEAV